MARVDAWAHSLDIIVRLDRDRVGSDIGSGSDNGKASKAPVAPSQLAPRGLSHVRRLNEDETGERLPRCFGRQVHGE